MKAIAGLIVVAAVAAFATWAIFSIGRAGYWRARALAAERAAEAARLHAANLDHELTRVTGPQDRVRDWRAP